MYYKDMDSYNETLLKARMLRIIAITLSGEAVQSSYIPFSDAVLRDIEEDIDAFYAGASLAIWNKDIGAMTHVHLRDVREVKIIFTC